VVTSVYPEGRDCSGLVSVSLLAAGWRDVRTTYNSKIMFAQFQPTYSPEGGDFSFYGTEERVEHVMIVMSDGRVFGACGGDSETVNPLLARMRRARVQYRQDARYRGDFIGYRVNPLRVDPLPESDLTPPIRGPVPPSP
jgi:hypothetical protein